MVERGLEFVQGAFSPLRDLEVEMTELEDMQTNYPCDNCGGKVEKQMVLYQYDWFPFQKNQDDNGGDEQLLIIISKRLPGWFCENEINCGGRYRHPGIRDKFLDAVATSLSNLGDNSLKDMLLRNEDIKKNPEKYFISSPIPQALIDQYRPAYFSDIVNPQQPQK